MHTDLSEVLWIGIPALALFALALVRLVFRELAPTGQQDPAARWILLTALGGGTLGFALKLVVAVLLVQFPPHPAPRTRALGLDESTLATSVTRGEMEWLDRRAPYVWKSLPNAAPAPAANPSTPEKIALGRRLFDEKLLSDDGSLACSSCHDLIAAAGADHRNTAIGIHQQHGPRNTPTVWNAAFQALQFWDGRASSLESQATGPILNPIEMGLSSPQQAAERLARVPEYRVAFAAAFPDNGQISLKRIAEALSAFERTLVTADTAYDRFVRGDARALSAAAQRGMRLFEDIGCVLCHRGPNFSDASVLDGRAPLRIFPANRSSYDSKYHLLDANGKPGTWRIPSLRNVALTGPWLHNGSVTDLREVVRVMAAAQLGRTGQHATGLNRDGTLRMADANPLTVEQVSDIVAFLESLSSERLLRALQRGAVGSPLPRE